MPPMLRVEGFPKLAGANGELGRRAGEGRGEGILCDLGERERTGERAREEAVRVDCFAAAPEIAFVVAFMQAVDVWSNM